MGTEQSGIVGTTDRRDALFISRCRLDVFYTSTTPATESTSTDSLLDASRSAVIRFMSCYQSSYSQPVCDVGAYTACYLIQPRYLLPGL